MQLKKTHCVFLFFFIFIQVHSQEIKKIEYIFLSRPCDTTYYGIINDKSRASFSIYYMGYHIKSKRDSLSNVLNKRRWEFPNVIPSEPQLSMASSFWSTRRKNIANIEDLPYITLEEFYRDTSKYYLESRLFFIIPLKNGTFDLWESGRLGQE